MARRQLKSSTEMEMESPLDHTVQGLGVIERLHCLEEGSIHASVPNWQHACVT